MSEHVAIVGSRDFPDMGLVVRYVACLEEGAIVISGGAIGVDTEAAESARKYGFRVIEVLPDYNTYGRRAPLVRNKLIAEKCDRMVAFWDGKSRGTYHAMRCAMDLGKPVMTIRA